MKFDMYLKNKRILKMSWSIVYEGQSSAGQLVFGFEGQRVLFNFHFDNYISWS